MKSRPHELLTSLFAVSSISAFVCVANAVGSGAARTVDETFRRRIARSHSPALDSLSSVVTGLTSPALLIASSFMVAFAARRRGVHVWLPILSAPFAAMVIGRAFTEFLPQQNAPEGKDGRPEPSFPSGHTTGATTEAFTIAYVLRRNGAIGDVAAATIALLPFVGGVNRLYRDRHWTSDIVAGWTAGATIATALAAWGDAISR